MKKKITKKEFIKKAKGLGYEPHKNNIDKAVPIDKICGTVKTKYRIPIEKLFTSC